MTQPFKIVVFMPLATQRGGAEQLLTELIRHGRRPGVEWLVVFFEEGPMRDAFDALGVQTRVLETGRLREVRRYARSVRAIARLLREEHADVAFSWMMKAHLYAAPAAWWAGVPAMWYQHGVPDAADALNRLATLLPARGLLACSRAAVKAQRRFFPARPVRVVHPCVDLDRFDTEQLPSPIEARRQLGFPAGGPLIGTVARLQRWKGVHTLIEAMPQILEAHPDAHAVVVGGRHELEPAYEAYVHRQVRGLGLNEHVTLAGFQADVPLWMQAMDVFVHASDNEPFGMVVIEAMALGKPVVAGARGGPREIITEGEDGLLAPYDDASALARQVLCFIDEPAFSEEIGQAARRRAAGFSPSRYADVFLHAVRRTLGEKPPSEQSKTASDQTTLSINGRLCSA